MEIQRMTLTDYSQLFSLWKSIPGVGINERDDSEEGISLFLARNPSTCFTAKEDGRLVGSVLCGFDGRRAYIYHMCVDVSFRNKGIASSLMKAVEEELSRMGVTKSALVVFRDNEVGNAFWQSSGWVKREDLNYYSKFI